MPNIDKHINWVVILYFWKKSGAVSDKQFTGNKLVIISVIVPYYTSDMVTPEITKKFKVLQKKSIKQLSKTNHCTRESTQNHSFLGAVRPALFVYLAQLLVAFSAYLINRHRRVDCIVLWTNVLLKPLIWCAVVSVW